MHAQKALIVTEQSLGTLNEMLRDGWTVTSASAMGGGGQASGFASLVVLEKSASAAEGILEQIEEAMEEAPDAVAQDPLLRRLQDDADDLGPLEN